MHTQKKTFFLSTIFNEFNPIEPVQPRTEIIFFINILIIVKKPIGTPISKPSIRSKTPP